MRIVTSSAALPLLERFFKVRLYVAEQLQAGKMTFEQANQIITESRNEAIAKEKSILRQELATPPTQQPIIVQQPVVVDPGPTLCIRIGLGMTACD